MTHAQADVIGALIISVIIYAVIAAVHWRTASMGIIIGLACGWLPLMIWYVSTAALRWPAPAKQPQQIERLVARAGWR